MLLLVSVIGFATSNLFSQSVEGFKYHGTDGNVSLYYKQTEYGVTFRALNKRDVPVYVRVNNVVSKWSNGKTRKKTVNIGFVKSGGASNGGGLNLDNYAKIKSWTFTSWEWSTKYFRD